MQVSGFTRYSALNYQPDAIGDLLYNGLAPWTNRTSFALGVQGDGSWKVAQDHTARGGLTDCVMSRAEVIASVGIPASSTARAISPTD